MGNNISCKNNGVGSIIIKMFDNIIKTLIYIRHAAKLKINK